MAPAGLGNGILAAAWCVWSVQAVQVTVKVPSRSLKKWQQMCREEKQDEGKLLESLISTRQEILDERPTTAAASTKLEVGTIGSVSKRCRRFKVQTVDDAKEIIGLARRALSL
eukprot:Skav204622  [mRNA]  locus=scaffold1712:230806:234163:- [translate_table: standard]